MFALRHHDTCAERLGPMEILNGDGGLRTKVFDELGVESLELFRMSRGDLQDTDDAVPCHERRTQHRTFRTVLAFAAAVVVEQRRKRLGRLTAPLPPAAAESIEAVHLLRLQQRRDVIGDGYAQADTLALRLRPRDLLRDHP